MANLFDKATKAIAPAQRHYQAGCAPLPTVRLRVGRVVFEKTVDFGLRKPTMPASGLGGADAPLIDPLFERRVADAKPRLREHVVLCT